MVFQSVDNQERTIADIQSRTHTQTKLARACWLADGGKFTSVAFDRRRKSPVLLSAAFRMSLASNEVHHNSIPPRRFDSRASSRILSFKGRQSQGFPILEG